MKKSTITLTFGDVAENHTGMQRIGTPLDSGLTSEDILAVHRHLVEKYGADEVAEVADLSSALSEDYYDDRPLLLVVAGGVDLLMGSGYSEDLLEEQLQLPYDTKAWMKGRVVNKKARYNLCFSDEYSKPDYEQKRGTVIAYDDVPVLNSLRSALIRLLEESIDCTVDLKVESNYYYDVSSCYIGWHGDTERRLVIGCRLGEEFPLSFRWYRNSTPVTDPIVYDLQHGDIYFMSVKCTGYDWKKRSALTLRHCAGELPIKES